MDIFKFTNSHSVELLVGDCIEILQSLPANHFQTCVTSPPYYGLRDYGTATWIGGDAGCDHQQGRPGSGRADGKIDERNQRNRDGVGAMGGDCKRCGAIRVDKQIGLEPTPDEYIAKMVGVCREIKRVLRTDGTLWLNIGDSYATTPTGSYGTKSGLHGAQTSEKYKQTIRDVYTKRVNTISGYGIKPKDLLMIPSRMALALQADGWWLRSAIVWHKTNPMPESIRDRPTSSYEMVYLLTKSERYFYDADAISEPSVMRPQNRNTKRSDHPKGDEGRSEHRRPEGGTEYATRNARNVWTFATQSFRGAHFATMAPELARRCMLAGTSERGCCAKCGAPWIRKMETNNPSKYAADPDNTLGWSNTHSKTSNPQSSKSLHRQGGGVYSTATFQGWFASCSCDADTVPCRVLDPFGGAGTTGLVAAELNRQATLIELNPDYASIARQRLGHLI